MKQKELAQEKCEVYTLLGRSRRFPNMAHATSGQRGHIERAAINAPVQVITVYDNSKVVLGSVSSMLKL
jgi:DNA polymerase I-like protein with 3'-5' exonuclease and polymerase domains